MIKIVLTITVALLVSLYLFPIGATFLPAFINSKNILSAVGLPLLAMDLLKRRIIEIPRSILGAFLFAVLFSLICLYSVDYNDSSDFSYASYVLSFLVWMFGAYTVCRAIEIRHGYVTFRLLTMYLAWVCAAQCLAALLIDRLPVLQLFVDTYIEQGQEFYREVDRLYGIGASLDNAGVRFSVVLVLIIALICNDRQMHQDKRYFLPLILCFIVITVVGNMISRTTLIGTAFGLFYLLRASGIFQLLLKREFFKLYAALALFVAFLIPVVIYFYQTDIEFYHQIRFAFEGFFNWAEKGEWRTDSTDKLNSTMWIWPDKIPVWAIGTGLFDGWIFGTDIGYCRFVLYCGVIGFSVFVLFFIYNTIVLGEHMPLYRDLFYILLIISFIIWLKVSTDIFTFYALFYCLTARSGSEIEPKDIAA